MIRRIISINEELCNGCGLCAGACHEGAIGMVNGKAKLMREDYCDGLGDCLPACPMGAISFVEREAAEYNAEAVERAKKAGSNGCPGTAAVRIEVGDSVKQGDGTEKPGGRLSQWPVQIELAPTMADFYNGASLLIAADCTAYAYGNFHEDFISGRITLIGCPKLDIADYAQKLSKIFAFNLVKDILVVRMEVPCCGGIEAAVKNALNICGKNLPVKAVTLTKTGEIKSVK